MPVLVIGATGFMGPEVVRRLVARDETVVAVSRAKHEARFAGGVVQVTADRDDPVAILATARAHHVHAVIDMIAFTEASSLPLFEALEGEIDRYVLISSCDVYRNYGGLLKLETADPVPVSHEDSPLRQSRYPRRGAKPAASPASQRFQDEYDKIPIEQAVLSRKGFAGVVLRLPMVFGPRDHQRRFGWAVWRCRDGRPFRMAPAVANWRSIYGYVEDVAEAIALAATHPAAEGGTFNVGRADHPTEAEWAEKVARAMGTELRVEITEDGVVRSGLAKDLDLAFPLACDTMRIRRELGFVDVVAETEALRRTIADELARGRPPELEAEYQAEDLLPPV